MRTQHLLQPEKCGRLGDSELRTLERQGWICLSGESRSCVAGRLVALARQVGRIVSFNGQPLIMDVKPRPGHFAGSSRGWGAFPLHTDVSWVQDPPRYVIMGCVHPGEGGGASLVADALAAWKLLTARDRAWLKKKDVVFYPPSHVEAPTLSSPIARMQGSPKFRFKLVAGDIPQPPPIANWASALKRVSWAFLPEAGTVWILDNHRVLHGRTSITAGGNSMRWLKRVYASTNTVAE